LLPLGRYFFPCRILVWPSWHLLERWIGRASIFVVLFAGLIIATVWFWRWLSSREQEIRGWWQAFCERPHVLKFRRDFAAEIDWVEQRFSAKGFLGIHLTVGVFLLVGRLLSSADSLRKF
jgi:hypothetical protein